MTLVARNEADIVGAQIAFHLHAGVDFVIATDHASNDGTTEILEGYERAGVLRLLRETAPEYRQSEWVTRMARMAATELEADWVIHADADEFWWPRGVGLREALEGVPLRYGVVEGIVRAFLPCEGVSGSFAERMTARLTPRAAINDPASAFRPHVKILHRGSPNVIVGMGNHALRSDDLAPLLGWQLEVLHFPIRSYEHFERKYLAHYARVTSHRRADHAWAHEASRKGRLREVYGRFSVDDSTLQRGLEDGSLVVDLRIRDALAAIDRGEPIRFDEPSPAERASFATEAAGLAEADLVRLYRQLDILDRRLSIAEM